MSKKARGGSNQKLEYRPVPRKFAMGQRWVVLPKGTDEATWKRALAKATQVDPQMENYERLMGARCKAQVPSQQAR